MHVLRGVACTAICMNCAVCIIYGFGALTISPKTGNYGYHSWLVFVFTVTSILWKIDFFTKHTRVFAASLCPLWHSWRLSKHWFIYFGYNHFREWRKVGTLFKKTALELELLVYWFCQLRKFIFRLYRAFREFWSFSLSLGILRN